MKPHSRSLGRQRKRAFTLVELLVVLSVIIIIASAVFVSFNYTGGTRGLDKGLGVLHSMTRIARAQAILNGTSSRLIIHFDDGDPEKFLRYIGVVVKDSSCANCWRAVDRGVYLPKDIYVVPRSKATLSWALEETDQAAYEQGGEEVLEMRHASVYKKNQTESLDSATFVLGYPSNDPVPESAGTGWIAIQFAPNGRLQPMTYNGGGLAPSSNQLVLGMAEYGSDKKLLFSDNRNLRAMGFKVNGASFNIVEVDAL